MLAHVCRTHMPFQANINEHVILAPKTWAIIQGLSVDFCEKENKSMSNFCLNYIYLTYQLINFDIYEVVYYLSKLICVVWPHKHEKINYFIHNMGDNIGKVVYWTLPYNPVPSRGPETQRYIEGAVQLI